MKKLKLPTLHGFKHTGLVSVYCIFLAVCESISVAVLFEYTVVCVARAYQCAQIDLCWCADFQRRFVNLLSYQFHTYPASLGLSILNQKQFAAKSQGNCTCVVLHIGT